MIDKFRDKHVSQQPRACKASDYRSTRCRNLGNVLAATANHLRAHMQDHFKTRRDVLQHLRHILTQLAQIPTAARTLRLGLMRLYFARQMFRQRLAPRDDARRRGGDSVGGVSSVWMTCNSSRFNWSWSIIASNCSELRPNCIRRSLAIIMFKRSISARWAETRVFKA